MATVWRLRSSVFASRHWFVSCPGVAAELSIKPAGTVYNNIVHARTDPRPGRRIFSIYTDGDGGTKTLQLELPVAALVKQNT